MWLIFWLLQSSSKVANMRHSQKYFNSDYKNTKTVF